MTAPARVPFAVPDEIAHDVIAREPLWYAYAAGDDHPAPPSWAAGPSPEAAGHADPYPAGLIRADDRIPLPFGTLDLLETAAFPHGRVSDPVADPLGHALAAAFGPQWYDLDNPYNPHRGYASGRSHYPVQVFVDDGTRWRLLEPDRHALTGLAHASPGRYRRLALTGRYARVLPSYRWFRGSLVHAELGIALRALSVALYRFGLPATLRMPGPDGPALIAGLGLRPTGEWSLPLVVDLAAGRPDATTVADERPDDPVLAELFDVNRAQRYPDRPAPLGCGVPSGAAVPGESWAELTWRRNSGRVPAGLLGFAARPCRVDGSVLEDAARWLRLAPPSATLAGVAARTTLTVAVQNVTGYADGVHRVGPDGSLELVRADPDIAARLEGVYGYARSPSSGCDVRHAAMLWFLSVRPRDLHAAYGPAGWTAAQYVAGWAVHGLGLAATAGGLFARPVRAFDEEPTRDLLGLGPDEMIALAAIAGTPRHPSGAVLDIRL
ncbi:hypothetical protein [Dactylosporangium sp. NPDC051484]|uniref:hypothetical protein n=1 Tax=Dactylosporangium sp. NPDC051484 TaxID=3154942 RepID=UPI00344DE86F